MAGQTTTGAEAAVVFRHRVRPTEPNGATEAVKATRASALFRPQSRVTMGKPGAGHSRRPAAAA